MLNKNEILKDYIAVIKNNKSHRTFGDYIILQTKLLMKHLASGSLLQQPSKLYAIGS